MNPRTFKATRMTGPAASLGCCLALCLALAGDAGGQSSRAAPWSLRTVDGVSGTPVDGVRVVFPDYSATSFSGEGGIVPGHGARGSVRVLATRLGYADVDTVLAVPLDGDVRELGLQRAAVALPSLTVAAERGMTSRELQRIMFEREVAVGAIGVTKAEVEAVPPMGEADVFRSLQSFAGVSSVNDLTGQLFVRGGGRASRTMAFRRMAPTLRARGRQRPGRRVHGRRARVRSVSHAWPVRRLQPGRGRVHRVLQGLDSGASRRRPLGRVVLHPTGRRRVEDERAGRSQPARAPRHGRRLAVLGRHPLDRGRPAGLGRRGAARDAVLVSGREPGPAGARLGEPPGPGVLLCLHRPIRVGFLGTRGLRLGGLGLVELGGVRFLVLGSRQTGSTARRRRTTAATGALGSKAAWMRPSRRRLPPAGSRWPASGQESRCAATARGSGPESRWRAGPSRCEAQRTADT